MTIVEGGRRTRSEATLTLSVSGSNVTGTMTVNGSSDEILNGSVRQGVVSFVIRTGMDDLNSLNFRGSVSGDSLTLRIRERLDEESSKLTSVGSAHFRRAK